MLILDYSIVLSANLVKSDKNDTGIQVMGKVITNFSHYSYSEYKQSLTFRVRRYVVIATKLVHRLQILLIVHN